MQVTLKDLAIEDVAKGRSKYQKATVTYTTAGGETRTQSIMSFANPEVFKTIQTFKTGDVVDVTLTKNDAGYVNWAKVVLAGAAKAAAPAGGKVVGSNYETPDERKLRQMYIIKQSSIANAIDYFKARNQTEFDINMLLGVAQDFVDFVYDADKELETMDSDQRPVPAE